MLVSGAVVFFFILCALPIPGFCYTLSLVIYSKLVASNLFGTTGTVSGRLSSLFVVHDCSRIQSAVILLIGEATNIYLAPVSFYWGTVLLLSA